MKLKAIYIALGMVFAVQAQAREVACEWCDTASAQASSQAAAQASAAASVTAIQSQATIQGQSQNVTVNNNQSGDLRHSGEYTVKSAPTVIGGSNSPSANCHGTSNVGLSLAGFGISLGSSWKDKDCQVVQTAMSMMALGLREDAIAVLCQVEHVKVAPVCSSGK